MPYSPETTRPDLERIGRYLLALANRSQKFATTATAFGEHLLELAEKQSKTIDGGSDGSDD